MVYLADSIQVDFDARVPESTVTAKCGITQIDIAGGASLVDGADLFRIGIEHIVHANDELIAAIIGVRHLTIQDCR